MPEKKKWKICDEEDHVLAKREDGMGNKVVERLRHQNEAAEESWVSSRCSQSGSFCRHAGPSRLSHAPTRLCSPHQGTLTGLPGAPGRWGGDRKRKRRKGTRKVGKNDAEEWATPRFSTKTSSWRVFWENVHVNGMSIFQLLYISRWQETSVGVSYHQWFKLMFAFLQSFFS